MTILLGDVDAFLLFQWVDSEGLTTPTLDPGFDPYPVPTNSSFSLSSANMNDVIFPNDPGDYEGLLAFVFFYGIVPVESYQLPTFSSGWEKLVTTRCLTDIELVEPAAGETVTPNRNWYKVVGCWATRYSESLDLQITGLGPYVSYFGEIHVVGAGADQEVDIIDTAHFELDLPASYVQDTVGLIDVVPDDLDTQGISYVQPTGPQIGIDTPSLIIQFRDFDAIDKVYFNTESVDDGYNFFTTFANSSGLAWWPENSNFADYDPDSGTYDPPYVHPRSIDWPIYAVHDLAMITIAIPINGADLGGWVVGSITFA